MKLTPGVTINPGDIVTSQTLTDLIANATPDTVVEDDLDSTAILTTTQTDPPTIGGPGSLWWAQGEQLLFCFHDEVEDTGVSLWMAMGPDRFDTAMLTTEPIPFGAAVQLTGDGRKVKLPPSGQELVDMGEDEAKWEQVKVVGFNNTGLQMSAQTAASGTWISVAVAGLPWAWYPLNRNAGGGTWIGRCRSGFDFDGLISGASFSTADGGFTGPHHQSVDISDYRGGLVYYEYTDFGEGSGSFVGYAFHRVQATSTRDTHARVVFNSPRIGKNQ